MAAVGVELIVIGYAKVAKCAHSNATLARTSNESTRHNLKVSQSIYYTNLPITYSPIYRYGTGGGGDVKVVFDIRLWILHI